MIISFIIKNIINITRLKEMGCTFSNQTYLSCQRVGQVIAKPNTENIKIIDKKIQSEGVSNLRKKNLRLNRLIVNYNNSSECASPLQTDREFYYFLGTVQANLQQSKVCTIQPAKRNNFQIPQDARMKTNNNNWSKQEEKQKFQKQNIQNKNSPILDCYQIKVNLLESLLLQQKTYQHKDQNYSSHSPQMLKIGQLRSIELQCCSPSTKQTKRNNNYQQFDLQVFLRSIVKQKNKVSSCNIGKIRNQRAQISKKQHGSLNNNSLNIPKQKPLSDLKCWEEAKNGVENREDNSKFVVNLSNRVMHRRSKLSRNPNLYFQENQALKENLQNGFKNSQKMSQRKMSLRENVKSNKQFRIKNSQNCLKTQRNIKKIF